MFKFEAGLERVYFWRIMIIEKGESFGKWDLVVPAAVLLILSAAVQNSHQAVQIKERELESWRN